MSDSDVSIPLGPFLAVVVTISLVGFLTGTSGNSGQWKPKRTVAPVATPDSTVSLARSYTQMRQTSRSEVIWPTPGATKTPQDPEVKKSLEVYLGERHSRRAYDGAPPTIPHPVRQSSAAECLACHQDGLRLGNKLAGTMPHDNLTNCNQCHVPSLGPFPEKMQVPSDPREVPNGFQGRRATSQGPRAWSIAPPQVPHTSWMRQNCLACHGEKAAYPMRTSHPQRQNCSQCHAASAHESLRPGAAGP